MVKNNGCSYGMVNRAMIEDIKRDVGRIETKVDSGFEKIDGRITELFNHQSSRFPPSAAWSLAVLGTLLGVAATFALNKALGA